MIVERTSLYRDTPEYAELNWMMAKKTRQDVKYCRNKEIKQVVENSKHMKVL